jgi:hypothetical protein
MTARHRAFAALLASGLAVPEAAKRLKVSERTARRWNASADVQGAIRDAQAETLRLVSARLLVIAGDAVSVLSGAVVAASKRGAPAEVAARISCAALDRLTRIREAVMVEDRLAEIERRLGIHGETRS